MSAAALIVGRGAERLPADIALAIIPSLPRSYLERLVQRLVDHLDTEDCDTDLEAEETDHSGGEDDFSQIFHDGPGCPISDPANDDDREEDRADWEPNLSLPSWSVEA